MGTRARAMIGLLALLAVASACGDDNLKLALNDLHEPEQFLAKVERLWHEKTADLDARIHDEARCYYAKRENAEILEARVFCGPIRYSADQQSPPSDDDEEKVRPGNGVWDRFAFEGDGKDGEVYLSKPFLTSYGTVLPEGWILLRPDGLKPPENAGGFAAPKGAKASSNFVMTTNDLYALRHETEPSEASTIVTPATVLAVESHGTAKKVMRDDGQRVEPAKGETFLGLRLSFSRGPYANDYADAGEDSSFVDADVKFFVDHDGKRTPLFEDGIPKAKTTVIASVPKDGDAELVVVAAGEEQTISFTTGERTSDNAAAFYASEEPGELLAADVDEEYPTVEEQRGDFSLKHYIRFDEATLTPFHPELGWAEDGKVWLVLDTSDTKLLWDDPDYRITIDRAASAHVEVGGETIEDASKSTAYEVFAFSDTLSFVFAVPEDERSFDFTYEPVISFRHPEGAASPPSGELRLDPVEFTIDFSGE